MIKTNEQLAQFIKDTKESKGITKYRICKDAKISDASYKRLESEGVANITTLFRVFDALGLVMTLQNNESITE